MAVKANNQKHQSTDLLMFGLLGLLQFFHFQNTT